MRGGKHGHTASGLDGALKKWDRAKREYGSGEALNTLLSGLGDERVDRLMRHVTGTHSIDVDAEDYEEVSDLVDMAKSSANWSSEQLGDALVRAADVADVHDALDDGPSFVESEDIVERAARTLRETSDLEGYFG